MALAHPRVEQRVEQRQVRLELVELRLHARDDAQRPVEARQRLAQLVERAPPVADVLLDLLGLELEDRPLHPLGERALEVLRRLPQRDVRLERRVELGELRPLGLLPPEEHLARVVQLGALLPLVELLLEESDRLGVRLGVGQRVER